MVFINMMNDVTIAPSGSSFDGLMQAARQVPGMTFEQAAQVNRIYQNNGLICQRQMCNSMTGCEDINACASRPDWKQVLEFCGPVGTPAVAMDGEWWRLQPADSRQQLLTATQQATGMNPLPTAYNTTGMY